MICPECESATRVSKTTVGANAVTRALSCLSCGIRYESTETITHKFKARSPQVAISGQRPPPTVTNQPSLAANGLGREGWGVSSGLDSGSDPIPPSVPSRQSGSGARARVSNAYSPAFEAFWAATWKAGAKGDAQKAWREQGQPTADGSAPAIAAYLAAKKASGQSLQNVGVWLRAGGARQTEWHLVPIGKPNAQPPQRPAPYHAPVREPGWMSAPPPKPWPKREERSDDTLTPPDWVGLDEKLAAAKGTG